MSPERHPETIDLLAGEYVLGTLRGPARRRFEAWRARIPLVEQRSQFWEEHLMQLARGLRPDKPPSHVWQRISVRLGLSESAPARRPTRVWALTASVVLVVGLAALLYWRSTSPGPLAEVATIATSSGTALWKVEVYGKTGRLIVRAANLAERANDRDYELWALPAGGAPVSLGVLPETGVKQRALTPAQREALSHAQQVAVTLEPVGGSPTGQPTSTPIFVVPLRSPS